VSERVYATLAERAAVIVRGGHSAVVDAVYARASDRQVIEQVAAAASVPFIGLWLEAPEPVLIARTEQRRNDPSDADANVIRTQSAQGAGEIAWCRIDASLSASSVLSRATERVRDQLHGGLNDVADEDSRRGDTGPHGPPVGA
jgi:predicted kinase